MLVKRLLYLSAILLIINLITCSQSSKEEKKTYPKNKQTYSPEKLQKLLQILENDSVLQSGILTFALKSTRSGETILAHHAEKTVNVASCFKAITTATALDILGNDFTFKTDLEYEGVLQNGILKGNLFIKGGGDPVLGSTLMADQNLNTTLATWIKQIQNAGIKQIEGGIITDEDLFSANVTPSEWNWGDIGNYYGAAAGAINVADNSYKLFFRPTRLGEIAQIVKTDPYLPDLQFINEVRTAEAGTGDQASIQGAPYTNLRTTLGTIPMGGVFSIRGAIPDPALFLSKQLTQKLRFAGISIVEEATTTRLLRLKDKKFTKTRILIYRHLSPKLKYIIDFTNFYSVNLYAEAILKMMGLVANKRASTLSGTKVIKEYWEKKGISSKGFYLQDGSGLALANGITTNQLTEIFHQLTREKYFNSFYSSLPVAGISGTMKTVAAGTKAQNNLRAKTGGMTRVIAYVGYFKTQSGELMTFALAANQYTCKYDEIKKKLEEVLVVMVEGY